MAVDDPEEISILRVYPRPSEAVTLSIPIDTMAEIQAVAASRDMSPEALLKLYVGTGLRQDIARRYADSGERPTGS